MIPLTPTALSFIRRGLFGLLILWLSVAPAEAVQPAPYEQQIARAKAFAAEKSWALARDAYAVALPLASDAAARHWCELQLEDATWHSERPLDWQPMEETWFKRHLAVYATLLAPYTEGRSKDDFWREVMNSRASLKNRMGYDPAWDDRLEIADYLAGQPSSARAAADYAAYVRSLCVLAGPASGDRPWGSRLLAHVEQAARVSPDPDERALFKLIKAERLLRTKTLSLETRELAWRAGLSAANGTRWESSAKMADLFWRLHRSGQQDRSSRQDAPAWLAEIDGFRRAYGAEQNAFAWQQIAAQAAELEGLFFESRLRIAAPDRVQPGQGFQFSVGVTNLASLHAELRRVDPGEHLGVDQEDGAPSAESTPLIEQWELAPPDHRRGAWTSQVVTTTAALPPGIYELRVEGRQGAKSLAESATFFVSRFSGMAFTNEPGDSRVFVQAADSKEPVANLEVEGLIGVEDRPLQSFRTRTDSEGSFTAPALMPAPTERSRRESVVALVNGEPVGFERRVRSPYYLQDRLLMDAVFDRPLYRPGETVHWKLIARQRADGKFITPSQLPALALIAELNGDELFRLKAVRFNEFGSARGEFTIPPGARPGDVRFVLGEEQDDDGKRWGGIENAFRVDNYVPPAVEAKIELASGSDSLQAGHEIVAKVHAAYLSGGPVVGAQVETGFQIEANRSSKDAPADPRFEEWVERVNAQTMTATTDGEGNAEFRLQVAADIPGIAYLQVKSAVTPEGVAEVQAEARWFLSQSGYFLTYDDWPRPQLRAPGDDLVFSGRITDGTYSSAQIQGEARLVELRWTEAWLDPEEQLVTGPDLGRVPTEAYRHPDNPEPHTWRRLHGDYAVTTLATQPISTDSAGRFQTSFRLPQSGVFQIRIYHRDTLVAGGQEPLRVGPTVFAADAATQDLALPRNEGFVVGPDSLAPGQAFSVLAVLPAGDTAGWLTIAGENTAIAKPVLPQGRIALLQIDHPPIFCGYAELKLISPGGTSRNSRGARGSIPCVDRDTRLQVALTAADPAVRPGSETTAKVRITDRQGRPVRTEVTLTAFDEALARLLGNDGRTSNPVYHEMRRSADVSDVSFGNRDPQVVITTLPDPRLDSEDFPLIFNFHRAVGEENGFTTTTSASLHDLATSDEDVTMLSPFEVSSGADFGYAAESTLAGTRLRTELKERPRVPIAGADPDLPIIMRRHFSATACWAPDIVTDAQGEATVAFKYPDNLTQWRLEAYALSADGNAFGKAATFTRTSLPFQARLQLPRFLVAGDTAEPSALLLNRTDVDLTASAELKISGPITASLPALLTQQGISVPKQGEAHTAWTVQAQAPGLAEFTLTGRAGREGDGMVLPLPVLEDGIQQLTADSGRLAPGNKKLALELSLPSPLDPRRARVTVQLSPSHAAAVLDALPYLVDYPYGCVEQTMSRFLPAVVARKTLAELGLNAAAVEQRILVAETTADTRRRTASAGLAKLDEVVQKSLDRLTEAQVSNGGFGWWPGAGRPDLWMTAYVAWGLNIAQSAGVAVPAGLAERTANALIGALSEDDAVSDEHAWALAALSGAKLDSDHPKEGAAAAFARIFGAREKLSPTGRACLAQAAVKFGTAEQRAVLLRNLENGAARVRAAHLGDTVHWGQTGNYRNAMDGAVEATALTLLALLDLDPQHPLIEPAVNWLVLNRRSAHWQSTRDSAFAILALTRYLALRRELGGDLEAEVFANGKSCGRVILNRDSVLRGPTTLDVPAALLRAGANTFTLQRITGTGPLYAVVVSSAWSTSASLQPTGHQLDVARTFVRQKAEPTLIGTLRVTPQTLSNGDHVVAGEEVSAQVTLTVPNDLEYVMIAVPKPAGCEPLNSLSGWDARLVQKFEAGETDDDEGQLLYREERDDQSVFFLDRLPAGTWEIRFGMRAVTPGDFRALPVQATAMYVPEITANSDARRVKIQRPPQGGSPR